MEAIGIDIDTPLQLKISGNALIVTPVNVGVSDEALDQSLEKIRKQYSGGLRNLAK